MVLHTRSIDRPIIKITEFASIALVPSNDRRYLAASAQLVIIMTWLFEGNMAEPVRGVRDGWNASSVQSII